MLIFSPRIEANLRTFMASLSIFNSLSLSISLRLFGISSGLTRERSHSSPTTSILPFIKSSDIASMIKSGLPPDLSNRDFSASAGIVFPSNSFPVSSRMCSCFRGSRWNLWTLHLDVISGIESKTNKSFSSPVSKSGLWIEQTKKSFPS